MSEPETTTPELPEWFMTTQPEHDYRLVFYASGDRSVEEIEMNPAEYIALKDHLVALRGFRKPDAA